MAQAQQTPTTHPFDRELPRALTAAVIAMALSAGLIAVVAFTVRAPVTDAGAGSVAVEATDGWMSYVGDITDGRRTVDGWSSYLTPREAAVTDGWSSYLGAAAAPTAIDGWMSRYGASGD